MCVVIFNLTKEDGHPHRPEGTVQPPQRGEDRQVKSLTGVVGPSFRHIHRIGLLPIGGGAYTGPVDDSHGAGLGAVFPFR